MSKDSLRTNKDIVERVEQLLQAAYKENSEFNDALDGDKKIEIASLVPDQGSHKLDASEILFWTDRKAYNDELAFWEPNRNLELHSDAIKYLKENNLAALFHDLVEAIKRNRIAPFIGAGFSVPCGFPLWGEALKEISKRISDLDLNAFNSKMDSYDYLGAAQLLWDKDESQVKNYIQSRFHEHPIIANGIKGPIEFLPRMSNGCIVTTNFDHLIELTVKGQLDGYMHGNQIGHMFVSRLLKGDRCILKLHGDAANSSTYVFTESQYTHSYGSTLDFSKPLPKALRQIFVSHSLLFLGCSMEQDRTLDLFQRVCDDKLFEIPEHFAILPLPSGNAGKIGKETRLLKLNIKTLWYPPNNNHDFVQKYLALAVDMAEGRISSF